MNFIKIKDDYINLDNVTNIRICDHGVVFAINGLDDDVIIYHDDREPDDYTERTLTTEELEQLKGRVQEKCNT